MLSILSGPLVFVFLSWVSIYSFPQEAEDWKYAVHALRIPATETSHPDSPHKVVRILEQAKRQLLIKEATSHAWTAIFSYLQNIIYVKADLAGAAYVAWGQSWTQYTRVNHERVTRVKIASLGCKTSRGTIIKSSFIVVFVFVTKLMTTVFFIGQYARSNQSAFRTKAGSSDTSDHIPCSLVRSEKLLR